MITTLLQLSYYVADYKYFHYCDVNVTIFIIYYDRIDSSLQ